jgi:hydrogenase small subunit
MNEFSLGRRDFLQLGAKFAAVMGFSRMGAPLFADALTSLGNGTAPVLWLQGLSCSGCSVSLLNGDPISPDRLITRYISLAYHPTLSAATGTVAVEAINRLIDAGGFVLAVEGAVPAGMPRACVAADETFGDQLVRAARRSKAVLAIGTCASNGGVPAAEGNPTGAVSVPEFLSAQGITTPVVNIPGCPSHPDWVIGSLAHLLKIGVPPLDAQRRPKAFFGRLLHEQCPRFADYERETFARKAGDPGCLFKLGCLGPITYSDCPVRGWNSGTNHCIRAGAPCTGCASSGFGRDASFPLSRKLEKGTRT